tara:strand:- start:7668 stop:8567 length:900 start_codon:yes stop_codon:yes gene_type:complete
MESRQPTYGGQAVIEGVMIRGQNNTTVSVRSPSGNIVTRTKPLNKIFTGLLRKTPIIRGIIALSETLYIGMDSLSYSAKIADPDEYQNDDEINQSSSKLSTAITIALSTLLAIGLFFILPLLASTPFEYFTGSDLISNIAEGIIRLLVFIIYIFAIGMMDDIKRVYMYHGAEHMTVHAQEEGKSLTVKNISNYPTAHPRCGTAFLLNVMLISIIIFSLIPREPFSWLILSRIILIPLIASLSYETIRISSIYDQNILIKFIMAPSLWLQKLTTKQPDDDQIEVAIEAMTASIKYDSNQA